MSEGGAGLLPCCPWSWVTVGAGYPSLIPKLPVFSPINTALCCGKNARAPVYNLALPAYLTKPGCAA